MFGIFDYLRNGAKNAILGGVADAIQTLQGDSSQQLLTVQPINLQIPALPWEEEDQGKKKKAR